MLKTKNLNSGYGETQVLHDLTFQMGDHEALLILGPNGHGKTTLLRTISGLIEAWSGEIRFLGDELVGVSPHEVVERGIAHIPQGDMLFPNLTVEENLLMGAFLPEAWKHRTGRIDDVYEMFPRLRERSSQLAQTLSGGERRMLALGRGMMTQARLYLIDEPSLGLAPMLIEELYEDIREMIDRGLSVIIVEENASHAVGLADRVYLLEEGRFVREGDPEELLSDEAFQSAYLGI